MGDDVTVRLIDWEVRFAAAMDRECAKSFDWNGAHCMDLAMASVAACRGEDRVPDMPAVASSADVRAALKSHGFETLGDALAAHFTEVPPVMAQMGDLGIVVDRGVDCAVVCLGRDFLGRTEQGVIRVMPSRVTRAFRI